MAQLIGYCLLNGHRVVNRDFNVEVQNQKEIEEHRQKLTTFHTEQGAKDFQILFFVRQNPGENLKV